MTQPEDLSQRSFESHVEKGKTGLFLLVGPTGGGKTTLALTKGRKPFLVSSRVNAPGFFNSELANPNSALGARMREFGAIPVTGPNRNFYLLGRSSHGFPGALVHERTPRVEATKQPDGTMKATPCYELGPDNKPLPLIRNGKPVLDKDGQPMFRRRFQPKLVNVASVLNAVLDRMIEKCLAAVEYGDPMPIDLFVVDEISDLMQQVYLAFLAAKRLEFAQLLAAYNRGELTLKKPPSFDSRAVFGTTSTWIEDFIVRLRGLVPFGINVVCTGHFREARAETDQSPAYPGFIKMPSGGISAKWVELSDACFIQEVRQVGVRVERTWKAVSTAESLAKCPNLPWDTLLEMQKGGCSPIQFLHRAGFDAGPFVPVQRAMTVNSSFTNVSAAPRTADTETPAAAPASVAAENAPPPDADPSLPTDGNLTAEDLALVAPEALEAIT
jgi:hypothetical protein